MLYQSLLLELRAVKKMIKNQPEIPKHKSHCLFALQGISYRELTLVTVSINNGRLQNAFKLARKTTCVIAQMINTYHTKTDNSSPNAMIHRSPACTIGGKRSHFRELKH
jgi:hypothetical protein